MVLILLVCTAALLVGSAALDRVRRIRRVRRADGGQLTDRDVADVLPGNDLEAIRAEELNRTGGSVEMARTWTPNTQR